MAHRDAPLTPEGRRRLCWRVDGGRPICHVAAEAGVARQTLAKWHARWQADGEAGLQDRSSRPASSPRQVDAQVEDVVEYLRRNSGPVMLVAELREFGITLAPSTIHRVLIRRGTSRLRDLDVTGEQMRQPPRRYEHPAPGDLVHVDVKKIGRIPDAGGWRVHGKGNDAHRASQRGQRPGYACLHTAIDPSGRPAWSASANQANARASSDDDRANHMPCAVSGVPTRYRVNAAARSINTGRVGPSTHRNRHTGRSHSTSTRTPVSSDSNDRPLSITI